MTFLQNYQSFLTDFNQHLENYLNNLSEITKNFNPHTAQLIETASFAVKGNGKRLRPYLVWLGYQIASEKPVLNKTVLNASLVSEIFHSFALIHDDIIDRSDSRRNQKTSHILFAQSHKQKKFTGSSDHFGTSMAILTGDFQIALSSKILSNLNIPSETKEKMLECFTTMFTNLVLGQYQDVYQSFDPVKPSEEMIMSTLRWKSGEYTIEFPLKFGGILAGADSKTLDTFGKLAIPLGIAFQIKDDMLGIFADSKSIGKSNLSDIQEGKNTLIIKYTFNRSNPEQKKSLNRILGNNQADLNDLKEVRRIVTDTGARQIIEDKITNLNQEAKSLIINSDIRPKYQKILTDFADFIINREN